MRELSRQVMALERAKLELEVRNRQLEASALRAKEAAPSPSPQVTHPADSDQLFLALYMRYIWMHGFDLVPAHNFCMLVCIFVASINP